MKPARLAPLLLGWVLLAPPSPPPRADAGILPDFLRLQFAGHQGMFSLGMGKSYWHGRLEPELAYGFAPAYSAGIGIHLLSQKTTWAPRWWNVPGGLQAAPLLGYSAIVALGDDYFLLIPEKYRDYYWPSALHFWFFTGAKLRREGDLPLPFPRLEGTALTVEIGASDPQWTGWLENRSIGLGDILSLALSAQIYF